MGGTHTFTLGGSGTWSADSRGNPADLSMTWSYSVTVQAVDAAGRPL